MRVPHFTGRKVSFEAQTRVPGEGLRVPLTQGPCHQPFCPHPLRMKLSSGKECPVSHTVLPATPKSDSTEVMRGEGEPLPCSTREPPGRCAHLGHRADPSSQRQVSQTETERVLPRVVKGKRDGGWWAGRAPRSQPGCLGRTGLGSG